MLGTCYNRMFYGCTSLRFAPELPATTLASKCYYQMFYGCTSLCFAPELPATTLVADCYYGMFYDCINLLEGPELPATTLANNCYLSMFQNCENLRSIGSLPATQLTNYCYNNMFYGCSNLTNMPKIVINSVAESCCHNMFAYCVNLPTIQIEYNADIMAESCFFHMFYDCRKLNFSFELPALTLASKCYYQMFAKCANLTTCPTILPATQLVSECYSGMFSECINLETTPELPATTLVDKCYYHMFYSSSKIKNITVGFNDWQDEIEATFEWVANVSPSGSFIRTSNDLEIVYSISHIPEGWTVNQFVEDPESEIAYTYDIVVSDCGVQKLNGIYKLVNTSTTGTARVFQHTTSTAKIQFTAAIDGWWLFSEWPNEDGDDYDFYCFNYELTGGPWYAVNSVTVGSVPTLTYGTVEPGRIDIPDVAQQCIVVTV